MADEAAVPAKKPLVEFTNHPKISAAVIAGAVTHLAIAYAKQHGFDMSGYESDIQIVAMGLVGYLVPNS